MTHVSLFRRIAWIALLLPFLALSSVPSGLMPGRTEAGTLTLVLCTADGSREMKIDIGGSDPEATHQGCPWALAQLALVLPEQDLTIPPIARLPRDTVWAQPTDLLAAVVPGTRTARAPPVLA